jgi:hypothetical protein
MEKEKEEFVENDKDIPITICCWYTYSGKRCKQLSNNKKFCKKHEVLVKDFKFIENGKDYECSTKKDIKFSPRSKEHLEYMMTKLGHQTSYVDVCFGDGLMEEGDISSNDYIELSDKSKYYYEGTRGDLKTKNIKLYFEDFCKHFPVIGILENMYCEQCYKNVAKKLDYPAISLLIKKD